MRRLEDDNGNGVIENGLAKDDGVELGVDLVRVENGENRDRVGGGQGCADGDGVDKGQVQRPRQHAEEPQDQTNDDSREEGSGKGKGQNSADIAEKVGLMQLVAGREDDGREEEVEEDLVVEADEVSDGIARCDEQDEADRHSWRTGLSVRRPRDGCWTLTCKDGHDRLMDSCDLLLMEQVAGEEGSDEQHDGDEESPCCE